ncbi:MAG: acyl-CoA thioesterase [Bacteroidia bacterium]|nr:thioesterase family protein [Anaerostipes sp.]NCD00246.1 acyl-CoA thioesterase [Bacteroidia bacterium]
MQVETKLIARYSETDQMGIIHHSNYAVWFEAGRTDFLKKAGIPNKEIEEQGVLLPLYEMNCKFKSPARYEDEIIVKTKLEYIGKVRIVFSYQVLNAKDGSVLTTGETKHAWTNKSLKPVNAQLLIPDIYNVLCEEELK